MAPSVTVRRLLAGTTALSVPLILVGVYTAIAGFGLTCEARWPLCDGAVFGLFPANWGSFVEWFHRLIAMLFGFIILGTVASAWRGDVGGRVRTAVTLATVLTPLQIVFGALTVTTYQEVVLAVHFSTAIAIFGSLVTATVLLERPAGSLPTVGTTAATTAVLLAVALPLTPRFWFVLPPEAHVLHYAFALIGLGGLLAIAVLTVGRARAVSLVGAVVLALGLVLSRVSIDAVRPAILVYATICTTLVAIAAAATIYGWRDRGIKAGIESGYSGRAD
jgi:cytochrome c oxidase assembly protein subunit 15